MKEELKEKIKDKDKLEAKIKKNEKNRRSAANNIKESISYLKKKTYYIFGEGRWNRRG